MSKPTAVEKKEAVRAAIIKAVPEIMELKFGCEGKTHGMKWVLTEQGWRSGPRGFSIMEPREIVGRPIRLADVLLAARGNKGELLRIDQYGTFWIGHSVEVMGENTKVDWNLRTDDLSQQSEECIDFIHSILCA